MGYSAIIVGSGITGATIARELTDRGKKVLVIDKRSYIGGNCADYMSPEGYGISFSGGHFAHSNSKRIWDYLSKFTEFSPYNLTAVAQFYDNIYSYPINLLTLHQLWGTASQEEAQKKLEEVRVKIDHPQNFEEKILSMIGEELYYRFIYGYNVKMWAREPRELDASLISRIPVRMNYDNRYFTDYYQGQPKDGYTAMFEKMLNGIEVKLNTPFDHSMKADKIIYCGGIDEFYDYRYGKLEYRSVKREFTTEALGICLKTNTDTETPYLRKFSYAYAYPHIVAKNHVTSVEYSIDADEEKDYPVKTKRNTDLYKKYSDIPNSDVIFAGRLGNYKYWDMDAAVGSALKLVEKLC